MIEAAAHVGSSGSRFSYRASELRTFLARISIEDLVRLRSFISALLIAALLPSYGATAICHLQCGAQPISHTQAAVASHFQHATGHHHHGASQAKNDSEVAGHGVELIFSAHPCCSEMNVVTCSAPPDTALQDPIEKPEMNSLALQSHLNPPAFHSRNSFSPAAWQDTQLKTPTLRILRI